MPDKYQSLHEMITAWFGGVGLTLIGAFIARMMWHSIEARRGRRKFLGWELLWEFPFVLGMGIVGEGFVSWLALDQPASIGLLVALVYLGPRGLEVLFFRWFTKKFGE